eukprot:TRINITY_DN316_c0_g1_i1.p1 TRINITY_DN316_c0_g1~~TRINITY_DN316_c0_g1_i1.p1  ORF type:complete len:409 (+),score=97.56 TRINITY_DN316_c0_g1_i1:38-1228(+)
MWWNSSTGNNVSHQSSGAYVFRPNGTHPWPMNKENIPKTSVYLGSIVQEVVQVWNDWASQTIRICANSRFVEVTSTIGPVSIADGNGKEVISRYRSDIASGGKWYTDSEGQEFQERRYNHRDYPYNITEPVAMNYFPVNFGAYIKEQDRQLTIIVDRSRGCASLSNGEIETMIQRRLLHDDGFGVGEPLNESNIVRVTERVMLTPPNETSIHRMQMAELNQPPILLFADAGARIGDWISNNVVVSTPMAEALPVGIHLISFKTLETGQVLLRLQNTFASSENPNPIVVNFEQLFSSFQIEEVTAMTLSANRPLNQLHRMKWKTRTTAIEDDNIEFGNDFNFHKNDNIAEAIRLERRKIALKPQEIATYVIRYSPIAPVGNAYDVKNSSSQQLPVNG